MSLMNEALYQDDLSLPVSFDEQVENLSAWAEQLHIDEAEYHHFPHSLGVFRICMLLADEYESRGIPINRRVLGFSAIAHDVNAHLALDTEVIPNQVFASKEHRSAWLTFTHLVSIGYDEESVATPVSDLIITTKHGEPCDSPEAVILRMADIFNTYEDFEVFEEHTQAFFRETCFLEGKITTFKEWLPEAMSFLEGFLDDKLPAWFINGVKQNINALRTKYLDS